MDLLLCFRYVSRLGLAILFAFIIRDSLREIREYVFLLFTGWRWGKKCR